MDPDIAAQALLERIGLRNEVGVIEYPGGRGSAAAVSALEADQPGQASR